MTVFIICLSLLVMIGGFHVWHSYRRYNDRMRVERDLVPPSKLLHLLRLRPPPVVESFETSEGHGFRERQTKNLRSGAIFMALYTWEKKIYTDDLDDRRYEIRVEHRLHIRLRGCAWWNFTFHGDDLYEAEFTENFGTAHNVSVYSMKDEDRKAARALFNIARDTPRLSKADVQV